MKLKPQQRLFQIEAARVDAESRTVDLSFSSETPVDRWFGKEILSHDKGAADLSRLNDGAPLLFNHDMDTVVGVVEKASIGGDKRGHATVRFARTAKADEVLGMVRDGIMRNVSFMYRILDAAENLKDGVEEYLVTRWVPLEISIVSVPADQTVGIGRAFADEETEVRLAPKQHAAPDSKPAAPAASQGDMKMSDVKDAGAGTSAKTEVVDNGMQERLRITTITQLAAQHKIPEQQRDGWIHGGQSAEEVARSVLDVIAERAKKSTPVTQVGLTDGETKKFSIMRAINAVADKNWNKAGFEAECSKAIAQRLGTVGDPNKFYVPFEIQKRDMTVATGSAGGFLVGTDNMSFIELLRNMSVGMNMGVRRLSGLQGNVTIPRQTAAATAVWLANEASTITESQQTLGQLSLSPKSVGGYTEISRQLALQSSPDAEQFVTSDLAAVVALAVDTAILSGSGASGQPAGIIGTSGVGSVTGTSIAYAGIVEFQTDTATGNALFGSSGYVTTPAVAGLLKQRVKFTSTASPIWEGQLQQGSVDGYKAMSSNQVPSANILFGAFDQVVLAEWGVLEIEVNPYANFQAGIIGIRAIYSIDVGVRYGAAFSLATSVT